MAVMHPAHTLPAGRVTAGAGVGGHFLAGGTADSIEAATISDAAKGSGTAADRDYLEGAVAYTLAAPGIAPWVGARAGIGSDSDAGITYSGRAVRVDGRHALQGSTLALSAGAGLTAILARPGSNPPVDPAATAEPPRAGDGGIGGLDAGDVSGWAADVPIVAGWRSDGEVVRVWVGARGGYERISGELRIQASPSPREVRTGTVEGSRWRAGGLVGFAVGVHPVWVGVELDASYERMMGHVELVDERDAVFAELDADLDGVTITPTGALVGEF